SRSVAFAESTLWWSTLSARRARAGMGEVLKAVLAIDETLLRAILALPHPDWLNWVFLGASRVGGGAIWVAAGLALFLNHRIGRQDLLRLILAVLLTDAVIDLALKPWIDRPRPPLAITDLRAIG